MHLCLGHSPLHGLREVGGFGQPLHLLYPQIRAVLSTTLGEEAARLLAEPVADRAADRLDWYAEGDPDVPPVCLATIPEAQRGPMMDWIEQVLARGQSVADQYMASEDPRRAQLGAMLKAILQPPDPANVFLVDGKPVIIGWGFVTDNGWSITPALWSATAAPLPIPLATVVSRGPMNDPERPATPPTDAEKALVVAGERRVVEAIPAPTPEPSAHNPVGLGMAAATPAAAAASTTSTAQSATPPPIPPEGAAPVAGTANAPPPPARRAGSPICCGLLIGLLLLLLLAGLILAFYPPALHTVANTLLPPSTEQERHWREQVAQLSDQLDRARRQCTIAGNTNTIGGNTDSPSQNPTDPASRQGGGQGSGGGAPGGGQPPTDSADQEPPPAGGSPGRPDHTNRTDRTRVPNDAADPPGRHAIQGAGHAPSGEQGSHQPSSSGSPPSISDSASDNAPPAADPWQSGAQSHSAPLQPERPTRQQREDFTDRMNDAGAVMGEITATLVWDTTGDLDLIIRCPSGQVLDYRSTEACGGTLDVDANNVRHQANTKPVENAFWAKGKATAGAYQIAVRYIPRKDETAQSAVPFQVRLIRSGKEMVFKGTVTPHQATLVTTFEVGAQ